MPDVFSRQSSDSYLIQVVGQNLQAMLVNDQSNTLSATSTFSQCGALEIAATGGYSRKNATLGAISGTSVRSAQASKVEWVAGAGMATFNKIVWFSVVNGSEVIHAIRETRGKPSSGQSVGPVQALSLTEGEKFSDQPTFTHTGSVS